MMVHMGDGNQFDDLLLWCHSHPKVAIFCLALLAWCAFWGFIGAGATQANLDKHTKRHP
jgi:hypothetical protein